MEVIVDGAKFSERAPIVCDLRMHRTFRGIPIIRLSVGVIRRFAAFNPCQATGRVKGVRAIERVRVVLKKIPVVIDGVLFLWVA